MRVANTLRGLLLGGLIVAGFVLYQEREDGAEHGPDELTSLIPRPVSVTVLTGRSS